MFILYTFSQGKSEFIGRTVGKPHVKLAEEPYTKPHFPPSLEWYELTRGPDHAGELLATFELLHVSYKICFKVYYRQESHLCILRILHMQGHRISLGFMAKWCPLVLQIELFYIFGFSFPGISVFYSFLDAPVIGKKENKESASRICSSFTYCKVEEVLNTSGTGFGRRGGDSIQIFGLPLVCWNTWLLHITVFVWLRTMLKSILYGHCLCGGCSHCTELLLLTSHIACADWTIYSTWNVTLFPWTYPSVKHKPYSVVSEMIMACVYFLYITLTLPIYQRCLCDLHLLQLQTPSDYAGLPALPEPKQVPDTIPETDTGPMLPVPRGIRPTLAKYR